MPKNPDARTLPEGAPEGLTAQLTSLNDEIEQLMESVSGFLTPDQLQAWQSVRRRLVHLARASENLEAGDPRAAFISSAASSDRVMGVAFAAGSLPLAACRSWSRSSLGWVFGAGLLLGLLLRRK